MRVRLALIPLVALALLAGCATNPTGTAATPSAAPTTPGDNGVAALSADEILAKATAALTSAKSFHAKGQGTSEGTALKIDLTYSGKDFSGTIDILGAPVTLVSVGNDFYLKAADSFWTTILPAAQQTDLAKFKDKYIKVSTTNALFVSLKESFSPESILKREGTISKGDTKTVNGVPAIGLVDSSDKSVLYIATQGEPYPLKVEGGPGAGDGMEFSQFNATAEVKAPAAAEVYDFTAFTGS